MLLVTVVGLPGDFTGIIAGNILIITWKWCIVMTIQFIITSIQLSGANYKTAAVARTGFLCELELL